jgi:hypothetical protein
MFRTLPQSLKAITLAAAIITGGTFAAQPAHAGGRVSVGIGVGVGGYYPAPVYAPTYVPPPTVVYSAPTYYTPTYAPAPTYVYPQPQVIYAPPPVYYAPPVTCYSPFSLSFGFGTGWGHWGGGHWGGGHWGGGGHWHR